MLHALTLTAVLFAAAPTPAPAPAPAQDPATLKAARELFQAGLKLYGQGRYAEALLRFEETWAVRSHPSIQFNLGRCHEQLGDPSNALRAYREYLRLAPEAADREVVVDSISRMERKLREKGLQQLTVAADHPGARVSVDGADVGPAPATLALPVGVHQLVVTAVGFEPYEQSVLLQLSQGTDLSVTLRAVSVAPVAVVVDAPRIEPVAAPPLLTPAPAPPKVELTQAAPRPTGRVWTWVAGGATVVGAGLGAGLLAGAAGNARTLNTLDPMRSRADADSLLGGYGAMTTGAEVAFAVAGVAAVTTIILLVVEK
jgi:hypothetical protein